MCMYKIDTDDKKRNIICISAFLKRLAYTLTAYCSGSKSVT